MARAAIYVRVSTTRQAERDLSLPDQIAQCRTYCERQGWEVADIFSEPGASALDEDRPVFQEMIFKATRADHPYDYVVVHSLSRFSRDALHSELYVRKLRKTRVELISITQAVSADASGEMFRKLLNVFDEHQSRENAKHVHRAMAENARQGFWNGSRAPFGYRTIVKERRGNKDKKVIVVDDNEAPVVRLIFDLATGVHGRPLGVKAIAVHLNERGVLRRGRRFATGSIHDILTASTYCGQHHFNRTDSRNRRPRPPSEWIDLAVPAIIDEKTFNAANALLQSRAPKRVPPRVVNGPTFLAGIARCGHCGAALIQNTGKGVYRYYCCSRRLKEGTMSCEGIRMPMSKLDDIVIGEMSRRVLQPDRLQAMLESYTRDALSREDHNRERLRQLRHDLKEAEAGLVRLLELVEAGVMDAADASLRERLINLRFRRDELSKDTIDLQKRLASAEPIITPEKVGRLAILLRDKLHDGSPELRQAYARLLLSEVSVTREEIRISGSKAILARTAADGLGKAAPAVLSFVRDWRTRRDSNSYALSVSLPYYLARHEDRYYLQVRCSHVVAGLLNQSLFRM
jgi:DNA invertase Pin-like site-specific DNA recombinase